MINKFMNLVSNCNIFQTLAANYLNIPKLLWLTTRNYANMLKGKTQDEIRAQFNIENDFTPAELERVQKENKWCEEK